MAIYQEDLEVHANKGGAQMLFVPSCHPEGQLKVFYNFEKRALVIRCAAPTEKGPCDKVVTTFAIAKKPVPEDEHVQMVPAPDVVPAPANGVGRRKPKRRR